MYFKIRNLAIRAKKLSSLPQDAIDRSLKPFIADALGIESGDITDYRIISRSLDARKSIKYIYSLQICVKNTNINADSGIQIEETDRELPQLDPEVIFAGAFGKTTLRNPLVVGSGPGGMFAAYLLAMAGTNPVIIDRGRNVERRKLDIDDFFSSKRFNADSNFLFGEGGAGTYSDGKLYTRINDPRAAFVLETFIDCGANENIRYLKRPHLGSDRLPKIIKSLRERIKALGGRFLWDKKVDSLLLQNGRCRGMLLNDGESVQAPVTIIAHGLGGESLTEKMISQGLDFQLKNFQIGCRIEHLQQLIDRNQYRLMSRPSYLEAAEYNLVNRTPEKANYAPVSTFCMCPGGEIVPVMNAPDSLSTNGMSFYQRNGDYANSALITTCKAETFSSPQQAFEFLRALRQNTFSAIGDYRLPAQDAQAFARGELALSNLSGSYKFPCYPGRIDCLLGTDTAKSIARALVRFEKIFPGFMTQGTIIGTESFISSPVRFLRNGETLESSIEALYVAGEGAGQAGGIISAAVDGLKIAAAAIKNYRE